jgi:hypothetical protein
MAVARCAGGPRTDTDVGTPETTTLDTRSSTRTMAPRFGRLNAPSSACQDRLITSTDILVRDALSPCDTGSEVWPARSTYS